MNEEQTEEKRNYLKHYYAANKERIKTYSKASIIKTSLRNLISCIKKK